MKSTRELGLWVAAAAALLAPQLTFAQYESGGGGGSAALPASGTQTKLDLSTSPLIEGGYISVLGQYQKYFNDPEIKNGIGATIMGGYRANFYAIETGFSYADVKSGINRISFSLRGLIFPFKALPMAYAVVGAGLSTFHGYPIPDPQLPITGYRRFAGADLMAGLGYLVPLKIGSYKFAIRAEATYRVSDRFIERYSDFITDIPAPGTFRDVNVLIGLQLPLRIKHEAPVTPIEEPAVVPVAAPVDTDGDGVVDGVDQCPDSPPGSVVDATGCPPPVPAPVCKTPGPGEKISLAGCGTGDNIVLKGVNFDTNKATLTLNAKSLLDGVVGELNEYPTIHVQVGGHTDSRGSAKLNEGLSQRRAASVVKYLSDKGVAGSRMTSAGFGASQPIADNGTTEGQDLNRRVELKIVSGSGVREIPAAAAAPAAAESAPAEAAPEAAAEAAPAEDAPAAPAP